MKTKMIFRTIFLIFLLFMLNVELGEATLSEKPDGVIQVFIGEALTLRCFTSDKIYPPSWTHTPVGAREFLSVYVVFPGENDRVEGKITKPYHEREFRVQAVRQTGEYTLKKSAVAPDDAGKYECAARGGLGEKGAVELIVIEKDPSCSYSFTEIPVLGENHCGHNPDELDMVCKVQYRGNRTPSISWVKTGEGTDGGGVVVVSGDIASCKLALTADMDGVDGSSYTCMVRTSSEVKHHHCSEPSPKISVHNIQNSTRTETLHEPRIVKCPVHELPHCPSSTTYKWIRSSELDGTQQVFSVVSDDLNLHSPDLVNVTGTFVCVADCEVRGKPCPTKVLEVTFVPKGPDQSEYMHPETTESSSTSSVKDIAVPLAVAGTVVVIVGVLIYLIKKKLNKDQLMKRIRINKSTDQVGSTLKQLTPTASTADGRPSEKKPLQGDHSIDIVDHRNTGATGESGLRARRKEERARMRMGLMAASQSREGIENKGFSVDDTTQGSAVDPPTIGEGIDYAEGPEPNLDPGVRNRSSRKEDEARKRRGLENPKDE